MVAHLAGIADIFLEMTESDPAVVGVPDQAGQEANQQDEQQQIGPGGAKVLRREG